MFSVTSNQSGTAVYTTATPDIEMTLSPNATPSQSVIPRNCLFQFPPPRPPSKATSTQKYLETETKNSCCATPTSEFLNCRNHQGQPPMKSN